DGSPKENPFIGSLEGFVQFWAEIGTYKIQGANGSDSTEVWEVSINEVSTLTSDSVASLAATDVGGSLSLGTMAWVDGTGYLKMPASHPQYGSNPLPDLPGWITHTAVTDTAATANWGVSTWFGGPWKAVETLESTSADAFAGSRTSKAISRIVTGSGQNGPSRADSALHVVVGKSD